MLLAITILVTAKAQNSIQLNPVVSVIADNTYSVHGNDVARLFAQLILIKNFRPLSTLVIMEERSTSNVNLISLSTPLRTITSHQFQPSMVRTWEQADAVAEQFINDALESGLLGKYKPQSKQESIQQINGAIK